MDKIIARHLTADLYGCKASRLADEDSLGVKVPAITIPVTPGRNLAVNLEVAAMNNRQKRMGYNAAVAFTEQMNQFFTSRDIDG